MSSHKTVCKVCKEKLPHLFLAMYKCKCKDFYCKVHLHNHACDINFHELYVQNYDKCLPKVTKDKVEII
jgi:hypothetical protein